MNVLAIGAHFDDVELGCSGALAKHVKNGDQVYIFVATDSAYSNAEGRVIRSEEEALREGKAAAAIIGAELLCGSSKTLFLEYGEQVNVEILRIIEEKHIDLIYTHWLDDVHHDHYNLARATLHVSKHVPRILMYCSNWYPSPRPFTKNFYVDITDTWETKERAIRAHESEMGRVGDTWINYFKHEAENNGLVNGVKYAEAFEVVKWLA